MTMKFIPARPAGFQLGGRPNLHETLRQIDAELDDLDLRRDMTSSTHTTDVVWRWFSPAAPMAVMEIAA